MGCILVDYNLPYSYGTTFPLVGVSVGSFGNPFLFLITSLLLTLSLTLFLKELCYYIKLPSIVRYIGQNTLTVLCLHGMFASLEDKAFLLIIPSYSNNCLIVSLKTILIVLLSLLCCQMFHMFAPNVVGKNK